MDKPDLVIPVRFDVGKIPAALKRVGDEGKEAGEKVKRGFDEAKGGAEGFGESVAGLMKAQMGLSLIKQAAGAMGAEFSKAADYVRKLAQDFADVRQSLQQVAALKGLENSNQFALAQVQAGAQARLMPEEWKRFQEQFQSYGGAYLKGDQSRFKDRGEVTADQQAEEYQQKIAEFAKARGIDAEGAAQLGGGLLQFSEGPQKTEDLMSRFGKVFKTLERAPTPVAQLLPQMSRVMAQGASPEEAAQLLGIMSEAMPGEEETGVVNTIKAITNQVLEGKGEALGQKKGMTRLEQVKAAVNAIKGRMDKGEDLEKVLHEIAPDFREMRGVKGFLTRGLAAGGFEREAGYIKDTPRDFVQQSLKDYESSDAGKQDKADAQEALARTTRGKEYQGVQLEIQKARTKVTESGELEQGRLDFSARDKLLGTVNGVSAEQQVINEEALGNVHGRAIKAGIHGRGVHEGDVALRSQGSVNDEIRDLLKLIAEKTGNTAETNAKMAEQGKQPAAASPPRPLVVIPPQPAGRIGG